MNFFIVGCCYCFAANAAIYVVANRKHRRRELVHGCRGARLVTRWGEGSEIYRLRKSIERRRPSPAGKSQRKTQRRAKGREFRFAGRSHFDCQACVFRAGLYAGWDLQLADVCWSCPTCIKPNVTCMAIVKSQ